MDFRCSTRTVLLALATAVSSQAAADWRQGDVTVIHTFTGTGSFGWAVSELADIDGDDVQEAISGAPFDATNGANAGRTFVHSGSTGALLFTFDGAAGQQHGYAIADAGDVDNDLVHDIIVGAPGSMGNTSGGHAFVYSGATGDLILELEGEVIGDGFGAAVAGAGDVNHDGHADLLVGATQHDSAGNNAGRAYIYSGKDGTLIRTFDGEDAGDRMGSGTAPAGDVNLDGTMDQIVGADNAGASTRGKAYVYSGLDGTLLFDLEPDATGSVFGQFFVAGVGKVDGDDHPDVYVGDYAAAGGRGASYVFSGADGSQIYKFEGGVGDGAGPGRGAGDVDGDGHQDILVGHYTSGDGASNAGKVVIFSGADGMPLRVISSRTSTEQFGFDGVGIGDVNADGVLDFLVSAANGNTVYVVAGYEDSEVAPDSFAVIRGVHQSGGLEELSASDDTYLVVQQRAAVTPLSPVVEVQSFGITGQPSLSALTLDLEAAATALPAAVPQRIEMWNYSNGSFDIVDERTATIGDSVTTVTIQSDPGDYIRSDNQQLYIRLRWFDPGNVLFPNWSVRIDQIRWTLAR